MNLRIPNGEPPFAVMNVEDKSLVSLHFDKSSAELLAEMFNKDETLYEVVKFLDPIGYLRFA